MTLERLIERCDASVKKDSLYCRDQELAGLTRMEIDLSPRTVDSIFVPHFTKQAKPSFPHLTNRASLPEAK